MDTHTTLSQKPGQNGDSENEKMRLGVIRQNKAQNSLLSISQARFNQSEMGELSHADQEKINTIMYSFAEPSELYMFGQSCLNYKYFVEGTGTTNNSYVFVYDYAFRGVCRRLVEKHDKESLSVLKTMGKNLRKDDADEIKYIISH